MTIEISTCPACGATLNKHRPETERDYEAWEFACSAVVMRQEQDHLTAEAPCKSALDAAVRRLNDARLGEDTSTEGASSLYESSLNQSDLIPIYRTSESK